MRGNKVDSAMRTLCLPYCTLSMTLPTDELIEAIDEYIHYYSHKRIKLKLKGLSPIDY